MRNSFVFLHTNDTSVAAATRIMFAKRYVVALEARDRGACKRGRPRLRVPAKGTARDRATQNTMFNTGIALRPCSPAKGAHPRKVFAKNLVALVMNGADVGTTLREYPRKDAPKQRVFGNRGSWTMNVRGVREPFFYFFFQIREFVNS